MSHEREVIAQLIRALATCEHMGDVTVTVFHAARVANLVPDEKLQELADIYELSDAVGDSLSLPHGSTIWNMEG